MPATAFANHARSRSISAACRSSVPMPSRTALSGCRPAAICQIVVEQARSGNAAASVRSRAIPASDPPRRLERAQAGPWSPSARAGSPAPAPAPQHAGYTVLAVSIVAASRPRRPAAATASRPLRRAAPAARANQPNPGHCPQQRIHMGPTPPRGSPASPSTATASREDRGSIGPSGSPPWIQSHPGASRNPAAAGARAGGPSCLDKARMAALGIQGRGRPPVTAPRARPQANPSRRISALSPSVLDDLLAPPPQRCPSRSGGNSPPLLGASRPQSRPEDLAAGRRPTPAVAMFPSPQHPDQPIDLGAAASAPAG